MIKKIFFQSIFFNFFFLKEVFAAESGGMPQLNPEFWISQIFWLTLSFGFLFLILSKFILPKISNNLELRKSQILENIETAEKQKKESENKIKEYETLILNSKNQAMVVTQECNPILTRSANNYYIAANLEPESLQSAVCMILESQNMDYQKLPKGVRVHKTEELNLWTAYCRLSSAMSFDSQKVLAGSQLLNTGDYVITAND